MLARVVEHPSINVFVVVGLRGPKKVIPSGCSLWLVCRGNVMIVMWFALAISIT